MFKTHRFMSWLLTFCFCFAMAIPAFAIEKEEECEFCSPKINLQYEQGSMFDMFNNENINRDNVIKSVYTYEQDGKNYRVYGEISSDLKHSYSKIYELNDFDEMLVRIEQVDNNDGRICITIDNMGERTVEIMDVNPSNSFIEIDNINSSGISGDSISPLATWGNGWPVNDYFTFHHSADNRYKISVTGIEGITVIITSIVSVSDMPKPYKITIPIVSFIVAKIAEYNLPDVYTHEEISYRWTNAPESPLQQRAVERVVRTFYSDRAHNNEIDQPVETLVYDSYYNE